MIDLERLGIHTEELMLLVADIFLIFLAYIIRCITDMVILIQTPLRLLLHLIEPEPEEKKKCDFIAVEDAEIIRRIRNVEDGTPIGINDLVKAAELLGALSHVGYRYDDFEASALGRYDIFTQQAVTELLEDIRYAR